MSNAFEKTIPYRIENIDKLTIDMLDPIDYQYQTRRDIDITIKQPEFTSVCPMTGLPDFGCITVCFTPDKKIIELKSLKYYLLQYRNVGIFYEHVVNKILDDLVSVTSPKYMSITGHFTARGGMTSTVVAEYKGEK